MVRNGQTIEPSSGEPPVRQDDVFTKYHDYRAHVLFEPLVAAVESSAAPPKPRPAVAVPPYVQSKLITRAEWAPKEAIVRRARGGDNWPLTWADDGHLYTAYGDANGFEP